jgi:hypothetical protein
VGPGSTKSRFTPQTLTEIAGLVGGFATLVIGVLNAIVGTYGSFSMYNSLISSIYKIEGDTASESA